VAPPALSSATWDAAGLRYLDGGGDGCTYPDEKPSFARRRFHHFTFYGFMLCFAATAVARSTTMSSESARRTRSGACR
jgi:citrate/tricarballylate utilization protein